MNNDLFEQATQFIDVLLPVPIPALFTYRVPAELQAEVQAGVRVVVPFGSKKIITGIVRHIHNQPPKGYEARYIMEVLDEAAIINDKQFAFFTWMADYYMCTQGEVLKAALPSGLKLSSESRVQIHPDMDLETTDVTFSDSELQVLNHLTQRALSYKEVSALLGNKSVSRILKSLHHKDAVILYDEIRDKYKPKKESRLRLCQPLLKKENLELLFDQLAKTPKQEDVVLKYLQEVPVIQNPEANATGMPKKVLVDAGASVSSIQTLIKNSVLEAFEVVVPRFHLAGATTATRKITLSDVQQTAQNDILQQFDQHPAVVLHGITGSGKTEIYIDLITKVLEGGSQVLYLLPEIAISTQIVLRLKKIFGNPMGVYHSRFSDNERVEVFEGVGQGRFNLVVGVRSALFLSFDNLGLIIVDEEHDASYKQQDPAPRYHARDAALMLARFHHAKVLLGSATPSLESYHNAQQKKFGWVSLEQRYGQAALPDIQLTDLKHERRMGRMKGPFSVTLLDAIASTIAHDGQAIIFQNRRGYAPMVQCQQCGWIPKCINCSVSLTYHQYRELLLCHYCGYREAVQQQCPECSSTQVLTMGYGTEKLEEELGIYFPDATIGRMDLETTRSKSAYESIIEAFSTGAIQILVGTQMVAKGLDFDKVRLVGIVDADKLMHFPDFRSYERAFQLMMQVSGRAGRRGEEGKVLVQTYTSAHALFSFLTNHDHMGFIQGQIQDRQNHHYPPYTRLIELTIKHKDKKKCMETAHRLAELLRKQPPGMQVLGPGEPMIGKIRNEYILKILIKVSRDTAALSRAREAIQSCMQVMASQANFKAARIQPNVDPI